MKFERFERNIHFVWNCCSECGEFVCLTLIYKTDNTFHDCWPSDTDLPILMRTQYGLSLLINNLQIKHIKPGWKWVKMGKRDISVSPKTKKKRGKRNKERNTNVLTFQPNWLQFRFLGNCPPAPLLNKRKWDRNKERNTDVFSAKQASI